jgi:hypothetical protein
VLTFDQVRLLDPASIGDVKLFSRRKRLSKRSKLQLAIVGRYLFCPERALTRVLKFFLLRRNVSRSISLFVFPPEYLGLLNTNSRCYSLPGGKRAGVVKEGQDYVLSGAEAILADSLIAIAFVFVLGRFNCLALATVDG